MVSTTPSTTTTLNGSSTPSKTNSHPHSHSHSHSHGHHGHDHGGDEEQEALMKALQGQADRGSRVTLIGLAANIFLTGTKGVAGYFLSSASLTADAVHSLSDLMGDFVTLFCWRVAKRMPDESYPYGYGKYESIGSLIVSVFLFLGAVGVGTNAYYQLFDTAPSLAAFLPSHDHSHSEASDVSDVRAAWFALMGVVVKEWLYRMTMKVGKEEGSGVLMANALHHRSDCFASIVALLAILGSALSSPILDPIGGLLVSAMILHSGVGIGFDAFKELVDQVTDLTFLPDLRAIVDTRISTPSSDSESRLKGPLPIKHVESVRAFKSGGASMVEVVVAVEGELSIREASEVEAELRRVIKVEKKMVREVGVRFVPVGL